MTMTTTAPDDLVLGTEAAEELGISVKELYRRIADGHLEPVLAEVEGRPGRWVHVRRGDLEAVTS